MRYLRKVVALAVLSVILTGAGTVSAQVCGDADGNGSRNIADLVRLLDYLATEGAPAPVNPAMAEMDGRVGITVSDLVVLIDYLFDGGPVPTCGGSGAYSFTSSPNDTLFLPRISNLTDDYQTIVLPLSVHLSADVCAFNLPFLENTSGGSFTIRTTTPMSGSIGKVGYDAMYHDTCRAVFCELVTQQYDTGKQVVAYLTFERKISGVADITPFAVDRTTPYRISIERDGDLYVPTVVYEEIALPPDTMFTNSTVLSYDAVYGYANIDTLPLVLTAEPSEVDFNLSPDQSWIKLVEPAGAPWTTPDTVLVTIDLEGVAPGQHTGSISLSPVDPTVVLDVSSVEVNLDIAPAVDTIFVSDGDLEFTVVNGVPSAEVFWINFTSHAGPVEFQVTPDHTWLTVVDGATAPWVTPKLVGFTVNHTGLPVSSYTGAFTVVPTIPQVYPTQGTITVSMQVTGPEFPPGDVNCDGNTNVTDLTALVTFLFRGGAPFIPCQ